ncbi:unnamed protein product, partial [marine sediment metagenome]
EYTFNETNTLVLVDPGGRKLTLKISGFSDYIEMFTIGEGEEKTISHTFVIQPTTVSISITSSPSGAQILVDDVSQGVTTPSTISAPSGAHTVKLTLSGYNDWQQSYNEIGGASISMNATFVSGAGTGRLILSLIPADISIAVPGRSEITSAGTFDLPVGNYSIIGSKSGYTDKTLSFNILAGNDTQVLIALEGHVADQPTDQIVMTLEPTEPDVSNAWAVTIIAKDARTDADIAAWILVDDVFIGPTTPAVIYLAQLSTFNIKLRAKGYRQAEQTYTTPALP